MERNPLKQRDGLYPSAVKYNTIGTSPIRGSRSPSGLSSPPRPVFVPTEENDVVAMSASEAEAELNKAREEIEALKATLKDETELRIAAEHALREEVRAHRMQTGDRGLREENRILGRLFDLNTKKEKM